MTVTSIASRGELRAVLKALRSLPQPQQTRQLHITSRSVRSCQRSPRSLQASTQRATRQASNVPQQNQQPQQVPPPKTDAELVKALQEARSPDLITDVNIPSDPDGILQPDHPAMSILGKSSLVIKRQLELMNVIVGMEQANRYIIHDGEGNTIGYIAEQDHGIGKALARQAAKTHRSFTTYIFNADHQEVLRIHRPFAIVNSRVRIYDPISDQGYETKAVATQSSSQEDAQVSKLQLDHMRVIGESKQVWNAVKRKYDLFTVRTDYAATPTVSGKELMNNSESKMPDNMIQSSMTQFAEINEAMLSWDFNMRTDEGKVIGQVNRSWGGIGREIFTDTGMYVLRMDAAAQQNEGELALPGLTIDQRAVMMATAVSIDFDYFSHHSSAMSHMPFFIPFGGAGAEAGAAGAAGAGAAEAGAMGVGIGVMEGVGAGAVGAAGRGAAGIAGAGAMEGGIAGAGTMAGYEAMQRGFGRDSAADDASPQAAELYQDPGAFGQASGGGEDVWGAGQDPWAQQSTDGDNWSEAASGTGDGEGGGGILSAIWDAITGS